MSLQRFALVLTRKHSKYNKALYKQVIFLSSDNPAKKSYYRVLNLSTDATPEEIKKSYLDLAKKYHPDTSPNDSSLPVH